MQDIGIILDRGIAGVEINPVSLGLNVATSKPEKPAAADHRHLPNLLHRWVPADHREGAAIVLPFNESQVHDHQEPELLLRRRRVDPLRSSDNLGGQLGSYRQRVVHHVGQAEEGG